MNDIARADFERLEEKVDRLTDCLSKLLLIEERQSTQGERIGKVEQRITVAESDLIKNDRKVDQWVNRGIGIWAFVVVLFALYKSIHGA